MTQVLVVAPTPAVRDQLREVARQSGVTVEAVEDFDAACALIEKEPPVVVLSEDPGSDGTVARLTAALKAHAPVTPLLMYLPGRDAGRALKLMSDGAYDCLCPPVSPGDFLAAAKRSVSRLGRRLLTARRVEKLVWWRRPYVFASAGVLAFLVLLGLGVAGLWTPPFQIYKLASDHPVAAAGEKDLLWVVDWSQQTLTGVLVQGDYLSIVKVRRLADYQPVALALADYYAYTASADGRLRRHRWDDALTVAASVEGPGPAPSGLAWDGTSLWSCDSFTGKIYEHDPQLGVKDSFPAPTAKPVGLAWDRQSLWVADGERGALWRLTREGPGWKKEGPFPLDVFAHNRALQLSGFTMWRNKMWIVSESGGVLVRQRPPKGAA